LLANVALSALDEHFAESWNDQVARAKRRRHGLANYRLVRYADDFVVMVSGTQAHADALRDEVAAVLAPMGLRLSEEKTKVAHIDEGLDFLGFRIQRKQQWGSDKRYVYTWPSRKSFFSIRAKVRAISRGGPNRPLKAVLHDLNSLLRGWSNYFRHGASSATFAALRQFIWFRVTRWLRRKHPRASWKWLRRRYLPRWWPTEGATSLFDPASVAVIRYRYRGAKIATPWTTAETMTA